MAYSHDQFGVQLVANVLGNQGKLRADPDNPQRVLAPCPGGAWGSLNLTPFAVDVQSTDAGEFFNSVTSVDGLINAYRQARRAKLFEEDIAQACDEISNYAFEFLENILSCATQTLEDDDACRIADFVSNLDLYSAVKAVESLLNSQADLALLKLAEVSDWTLHFDHLAIRCGCSGNNDAKRVVENLQRHHDYSPSQLTGENYFRFDEGWDAYVLYKILENGQQLRLFIDQSTTDNTSQIIQHWNHTYGYTAHHLAIRVTRMVQGKRIEVPLPELTLALEGYGFEAMTPTGNYTDGLLEQVFTRPEQNRNIPNQIRQRLRQIDGSLEASIENGKLLELLSRREIAHELKPAYFSLYSITFDNENPRHTAPVYPYFLPEQAAHVIRTSLTVQETV